MQFMSGDVIQESEEPFVKTLNASCKNLHCNCCFQSNSHLQRCAGCKIVWYCNSECQKNDWKSAHSIECKLFNNPLIASMVEFAGVGDVILKIIRLVSFLKLHENMATKKYQLFDGSSR